MERKENKQKKETKPKKLNNNINQIDLLKSQRIAFKNKLVSLSRTNLNLLSAEDGKAVNDLITEILNLNNELIDVKMTIDITRTVDSIDFPIINDMEKINEIEGKIIKSRTDLEILEHKKNLDDLINNSKQLESRIKIKMFKIKKILKNI